MRAIQYLAAPMAPKPTSKKIDNEYVDPHSVHRTTIVRKHPITGPVGRSVVPFVAGRSSAVTNATLADESDIRFRSWCCLVIHGGYDLHYTVKSSTSCHRCQFFG